MSEIKDEEEQSLKIAAYDHFIEIMPEGRDDIKNYGIRMITFIDENSYQWESYCNSKIVEGEEKSYA
jgi:hypothetical protein